MKQKIYLGRFLHSSQASADNRFIFYQGSSAVPSTTAMSLILGSLTRKVRATEITVQTIAGTKYYKGIVMPLVEEKMPTIKSSPKTKPREAKLMTMPRDSLLM